MECVVLTLDLRPACKVRVGVIKPRIPLTNEMTKAQPETEITRVNERLRSLRPQQPRRLYPFKAVHG